MCTNRNFECNVLVSNGDLFLSSIPKVKVIHVFRRLKGKLV